MNIDPRPSVIEERLKKVKRVIAVTGWKGGIGKSVTASTLALLLSDFDIGCVINIGSAGGLQPDQRVLDLVVPHEIVYTDVDVVSFQQPASHHYLPTRYGPRADAPRKPDTRPVGEPLSQAVFGVQLAGKKVCR